MLDDINNEFYAPEFVEYLTIEFMTYIPICGSLMLNLIDVDISRVNNAYVESHNEVMKIDVMNQQKKNSIGQAIRKLKEYVNSLITEANLGSSAHTESKINESKKPRYPDTASNPLVKDVWRRGIQSGKRRENHFEGQEIQRIVERVIASKRKAQGSDDEEINVPKEQKIGPLPTRRKRMQRMTKKNLIMESNKNKERIIPSKKSREGRNRANVITTEFIKQKRGKFLINKKQPLVKNTLSSTDDEETEPFEEKLPRNEKYCYLQNGIIDNISYYSGSRSNHIKLGRYKINIPILLRTKEFYISYKQFDSIVDERGLVNGQIIDTYAAVRMKNWHSGIMFMPTDHTRTAIGDYTNRRRKTNISLYHIDFPLGDVILLSCVFNFHDLVGSISRSN